jgi:hypothetical protein
MVRIVVFLALVLSLAAVVVQAEERSSLWPAVPEATGAAHPEGNEYMRKRHMDLMRHDRDLTMHEGDREIGASLKQCFDCHAAKDDHGQVVTYASDKHFCRVCHDFVAVKVDCFMCHRSTPEGVDEGSAHADAGVLMPRPEGDAGAVAAYLRGVAPRAAMRGSGQISGQISGQNSGQISEASQ